MNAAASSESEGSRGKAAFAPELPLQQKHIHIRRECRPRFQRRTNNFVCRMSVVQRWLNSNPAQLFLVRIHVVWPRVFVDDLTLTQHNCHNWVDFT